jgi:hypothetical protein
MQKAIRLTTLLIGLLAFLPNNARAQSTDDYEAMLKGTLMVELSGNEQFDAFYKKAVETHWKITPYKFVSTAELASVVSNKSTIMMRLVTTGTGNDAMSSSYFVILRGGKKKLTSYTTLDQKMAADFQFNGAETNTMKSGYRAAFLIKALNDDLTTVKKKPEERDNAATIAKASNYRVKALKTKTLLIAEETLEYKSPSRRMSNKPSVTAKMLEGYRYKLQIVPMEEIKQYISKPSEQTKDFCVFVPRFDSSKSYEIYDINTCERLYYYFPTVAFKAALSKSDFENLSDEIEGKKKK